MLVSVVLTSEEDKRVKWWWGYLLAALELSQLCIEQIWAGIEVISAQEWYWVLLLSLSLDDSRTTLGECLGRTWWSSPLDWTTYLYYFYKWLYTTSPRSYVLLECSMITWQGHVVRSLRFPCYLYLVFIVWLDICDQVFEYVGNFFLFRALITTFLSCIHW